MKLQPGWCCAPRGLFAAVHSDAIGTELPIPNVRSSVANGGKADIEPNITECPSPTDGVDKVGNLKGASAYSVWRLELVSFSLPLLKRAATLT